MHCVKCGNIYCPTALWKKKICRVCNASVIYQCKICNKQYTNPRSAYNHLKYECINDEPQYKCSQCEYKAKRKDTLRRHEMRKHSIKNCDFCFYKTIFKLQLKQHISLEHSSSYMCSLCGKRYMYLKSFNNHQKSVCGSELYFECNHCSFSTNYKFNLKVHIKSKHSQIFLFGNSL